MDNTKQSPAILSTATGSRGLERGLERAFHKLGWLAPKTIAYVEIEAFCCWNLVEQMEQGLLDPAPVWTDIKTFPWPLFRNKIHFITGGYPCQPFSLAGKQKGIQDPRHLWPYYKQGFAAARPMGGFFENVRQHLNNGYREVRNSLEELDYSVVEGIYSAEEIGAPHKRERLFFFAMDNAYRDELGSFTGNLEKMFGFQKTKFQPNNNTSISARTGHNTGEKEVDNTRIRRYHYSKTEVQTRRISPILSVFPMGQGIAQYHWEQPRIISGLDLSINGYNFTEDLLRLAGNSVVEQTAEFAFIDLLNKIS